MSIDLNSILHAAADDSATAEPATGQQLLARARQRSRRRRTRKIAVGATVLATAGTVAATVVLGAGSLPGLGGADKDGPATDPEIGAYHPIEVTAEVAAERCRPVLAKEYRQVTGWKLSPSWPAGRPIYAGSGVGLVPADGSNPQHPDTDVYCTVPHTKAERDPHWVTEPIADAEDTAGVLSQCGAAAGYDFGGWEVVTAMSAAKGTEAVLRSTNDYVAFCSLEPDFGKNWADSPVMADHPDNSDGQLVRMPIQTASEEATLPYTGAASFQFNLRCGDTRTIRTAERPDDGTLCHQSTALYDTDGRRSTDAATVEVSFRGGSGTFEVPVVEGYYSARLLDPAARIPDVITFDYVTYDYVVKDESGAVLGRGTGPM